MCAHLHPHRMAKVVGDQRGRRQRRHVTIDAPAHQLPTMRGKETTTLHGVARQASPRECHDIALLAVDIVACGAGHLRSEEHTSELQSPCNLVCRLLLEKKKKK